MGLPKHFFAPHFTDPFWVMRLIHYPNEEVAQKDHLGNGIGAAAGGLGCGRHTDYGFLTLVNQDTLAASHSNGGPSSLCLEAETRSGHWVVVPPLEGALAVNAGDMLETWSGGALRATPHRVRRIAPASAGLSGYLNNGACTVSPGASTPPPEHRSLGRLSVPFFFEPSYDSLIQPLQSPPGSKLEALQHRFGANLEADSGLVAPFRAPVKYGDHLLRKIQGNFDLEK
jgi:isopenicillin N synthase-like dioxygenase